MTYFSPDSITPVQYSNGADYQRYPAGDWRQLWQIRVPINLGLEGGQKIRFFLDGLFLSSFDLNYHSPNLHASNAALSNTTQDGADNTFHWLTMINGVPDSVYSQYNFNYGGIIGADANIQIYGSEVPLPCALLLLGSGLAGLAGLRLRNKLKNL
jgi:hypothetical protein